MCLNLPTRLVQETQENSRRRKLEEKGEHVLPHMWDRREVHFHSKCQLPELWWGECVAVHA